MNTAKTRAISEQRFLELLFRRNNAGKCAGYAIGVEATEIATGNFDGAGFP